ncbi:MULTISPECIES: hypothetical protein [Pseudomonas]|uniref:Uncharacterized protein n=1 Tax=Pseudomonas lutea TaxID=243924 RepID=A0A9X8QM61_9PSED|nr:MULTISPECIES: hypothetical protein [Pseudomonas]SER53289.1 hypothetical protein SAMN05216409_1383 [Pseudomonas lutea]
MSTSSSTSPKVRGRQHKPTRSEVAAAWERIRSAADQGDVQASALLIALAENLPVLQVEAR